MISRLTSVVGALALFALVAGCAARYNLAEKAPGKKRLLAAATEVIEARYPMSRTSVADGYVLAVTPATVEGASRTKRRVSVLVRQNYTGAYEPIVRVQHDVDVATPEVGSVSSTHPVKASPFGREKWRVMGYLEHEEEALTRAILARAAGM